MEIHRNNMQNGMVWINGDPSGIICRMAWYGSMEIYRNNVPNGVGSMVILRNMDTRY